MRHPGAREPLKRCIRDKRRNAAAGQFTSTTHLLASGLVSQRAFTMAHLHLAHLISFSSSPAPSARLLGSAIATFDGQDRIL